MYPPHGGGQAGRSMTRSPSPESPAPPRPPPHTAQPSHHAHAATAMSTAAMRQHRASVQLPGRLNLLPSPFSSPTLAVSSTAASASASASATSSPFPAPIPSASSAMAASLPSSASAVLSADASADPAARSLRSRVEQLERENSELKRSVVELGVAYNRALIEVKERWMAAVRAGAVGGQGAMRLMDGVGVLGLNQARAAVSVEGEAEGKGRLKERSAPGVEKKGRERMRAASPALHVDRPRPSANGITVSVGDDTEEDDLRIERVLSSSSSHSSHSHHQQPHQPSNDHSAASSTTPPSRLFSKRLDLLGHSAAVYALALSADGKLLASAGMDKSIRVWDMQAVLSSSHLATLSSSSPSPSVTASSRYQILNLSAHTLNISSLAFALPSDSSCSAPLPFSAATLSSSHLISASFDKTVAFHDLSTGSTTRSVDVGSFATSLAPSSLSGDQICYVGTTGKRLLTLDRRVGAIVATYDNDTMVSAVSVYRGASGGEAEEAILTGDHGGLIRTWSSRMQRYRHSQSNDTHNKPISHLHCLQPTSAAIGLHGAQHEQIDDDEGDERTLVATNSFDDVLRVYEAGGDRGAQSGSVNGEPADMRLLYELKGVKNQNWPIRSSFYRGREWNDRQQWMELNDLLSSSSSGSSSSPSNSPPTSPSSPHSASSASDDENTVGRGPSAHSSVPGRVVDVTSQYRPRQRPPPSSAAAATAMPFSLPHSRLLASGSADGCVYVFDVTGGGGKSGVLDAGAGAVGAEAESHLLQRLEGHRDRVYTCVFHPVEPVLLSAGADATVKVWAVGKT